MKLPGLVIESEKPLSDPVRKNIRADLEARVGRGQRGNSLIMEGGLKARIEAPLADFDWPELTGLIETRICMAYGVPPIIIHARAGLQRSTFANYAEARRAFYTETMGPIWELLGDSLTLTLLRTEGEPELFIRFRYDELPEFQESENDKSIRIVGQYQAGLITLQEGREALGYDPEPEGDFKPPPVLIDPNAADPADDKDKGEEPDPEDPAEGDEPMEDPPVKKPKKTITLDGPGADEISPGLSRILQAIPGYFKSNGKARRP